MAESNGEATATQFVFLPVADLKLHSATALIPEMRPMEWEPFLQDVGDHGIREPITVQAGNIILDGRHRWRAAKEIGLTTIPARVVDWSAEEQESYVYRTAVLRRHLSDDQRAILAARWRKAQSEHAMRERASKGGKSGGRGRPKQEENSLEDTVSSKLSEKGQAPERGDPGDGENSLVYTVCTKLSPEEQETTPEKPKKTHEQAADLFTVPIRKVRAAIALDEENSELADKVLEGKERT